MGWHSVVLPLVVLLAAGCAVSTAELRDSLDLNQASFQDKLAGRQVLIDEFAACTARAYDEQATIPANQSTPDAGGKPDGPLQAIHTLIARVKEGHPTGAWIYTSSGRSSTSSGSGMGMLISMRMR